MTSTIWTEQEWLVVATSKQEDQSSGSWCIPFSKKGLATVIAGTISQTEVGAEIILRPHQSVSNPFTKATLLTEVQNCHAGYVLDGVQTISQEVTPIPNTNFFGRSHREKSSRNATVRKLLEPRKEGQSQVGGSDGATFGNKKDSATKYASNMGFGGL
jgi:hypothetical protein